MGPLLWAPEYAVLDFACGNLDCGAEGQKGMVLVVPIGDGCVVFILR